MNLFVTPPGYHRSWRALIAAQISGVSISVQDFVPGKTDSDPHYLASFPPNSVTIFTGKDGTKLFDVNAIAYYVGNEQTRGGELTHCVTQWVNFADDSILPSVATWVYPCLGVTPFNKQNTEKAKENLKSILAFLDGYLSKVTYLVGDRLTQADVTLYTALHPLFTHVFEENYRKPLPHLVRWYTTVGNQPHIVNVVGKPILCVKEASFDSAKYAQLHPKDAASRPEKPKPQQKHKQDKPKPSHDKPKQSQKSKPKEPKQGDLDDDDDEYKPPPSRNPMAELPDGGFDMNEFKRTYSNNDIETVALPYFWQRFDPATHSIWFCEYLYPEELGLVFMTCNLINGMYQRLEKMLKFAFASMCIFGDDRKSSMSGVWFWRGTGLAFELDPDFQTDYESFSWTKLDPNTAEGKQLVHDYFSQKFNDKPFNQGKVFK